MQAGYLLLLQSRSNGLGWLTNGYRVLPAPAGRRHHPLKLGWRPESRLNQSANTFDNHGQPPRA